MAITPWTTHHDEYLVKAIRAEFEKVYKRINDLEDLIRYVQQTAPELIVAYNVAKRME